jgi:hypothetical protein
LFSRISANPNSSANKPPVTVTLIQPPTPTQQTQETAIPIPQNNTLPPPPLGRTLSAPPPSVADAEQRAQAHPNDPNAQLGLALAYWNAGMPKKTYDTIHALIPLAGPNNPDFYVQAGNQFKSQNEGWLPAATLYFQAVQSYALNGNVPNQLTESFREALYKGSNRPEANAVIPLDQLTHIDPAMALVSQGRNALFAGKLVDAHRFLDQAKQLESTMREAFLLEGEIDAHQNEKVKAQAVLTPLVNDTASTPEWIRAFAQQILNGIK